MGSNLCIKKSKQHSPFGYPVPIGHSSLFESHHWATINKELLT